MAYELEKVEFFDSERNRRVPVCLYRPLDITRALILFSVGYGGTRDGYAYLARAWSGLGLAVAVIEHVGSNLEVLKNLPQKTLHERQVEIVKRVQDPGELFDRPRDVNLVFEELSAEFQGVPLGLGGHSFGSFSVLASLGLPPLKDVPSLVGPLNSAAATLLISPQAPGMLLKRSDYSLVSSPTLVLTGTEDHALDGDGDFQLRTEVYDVLPTEVRNLVVLDGAAHMTFAGIGLHLSRALKAIESLTLAWWERALFHKDTPQQRATSLRESIELYSTGEVR